MVELEKINDVLVLKYDSERGNDWVYQRLNNHETLNLKGTFHVDKADLYALSVAISPDPDAPVEFKIGSKQGEYFLVDRKILSIDFDLWIHKDVSLTYRSFTAEKNVSIFSRVNDLGPGEIRIGGNDPD